MVLVLPVQWIIIGCSIILLSLSHLRLKIHVYSYINTLVSYVAANKLVLKHIIILWLLIFPVDCFDEMSMNSRSRSRSYTRSRSEEKQTAGMDGIVYENELVAVKTNVTFIGHGLIPIIVLDNVLPKLAYVSLLDDLRSRTDFFEGHGKYVNFPGKIAKLDRAIVDPLLDVLQNSKEVGTIYPSAMLTEQREHVRGFASILCHEGQVRNEFKDTQFGGVVAPAAVFYFEFDGVSDASITPTIKTGTAFYRERKSGLERVTSVGGGSSGGESAVGGSHSSAFKKDSKLRFEQIHRVEGVPNRMVFYPQDVLQKAWTEDQDNGLATTLPCSITNGRLAISLFFMSRSGGLEIVDVLRYDWKKEAIFKLQGGGGDNEFEAGHQQVMESEESRRMLENWRRLGACSFTKGVNFNVVSATCSLSSEITVNDGEELRIKGLASVDHPELQRGGSRRSPWIFRHIVLNGASKLTLKNLKLSGAYSGDSSNGRCETGDSRFALGSPGNYGCGHCQKIRSPRSGPCSCYSCYDCTCWSSCSSFSNCWDNRCINNCNGDHKGGALLINSASSITILIDMIFAGNTAYSNTGNIFATSSSATVYFMQMSTPSLTAGTTPTIKSCFAVSGSKERTCDGIAANDIQSVKCNAGFYKSGLGLGLGLMG